MLCVVVLFGVAGCGGKEETGPVTLVFWHAWTGYEGKFLDGLVDEFNRTHPAIQVKPMSFVIGDKLMAAIAGGIPPDVATVWDWMLPTMGESGCFVPLNDLLAQSGITRDTYLPNIWEYGMFSDRKYGVPTSLNVHMIYYNKAILREAGLDTERPPDTVESLEAYSYRLSQYDSEGRLTRIGFMPGSPFIWFWNFGGDIYDTASRRFVIDSPENLRALTWMRSFYDKYGIDRYRRFTAMFGEYQSPNNPFYTGKIAMREEGQWQISFIQQFAPQMEYGLFPFPSAVPGRPSLSSVAGSFWVIPTGCAHVKESWEFLEWLISPEQSARFAAALYNIPPMKAALESETFRPLMQTRMKDFVDILSQGHARTMPTLPIGQLLQTEFNAVIENVLAGDMTPAEGLETLQTRLQKALDKSLHHLGLDGGGTS